MRQYSLLAIIYATAYATTTTATMGSAFNYTQLTTNRYATSLPTPVSQTSYGAASTQATSLLPSGVSYTSYSLNPSATASGDGTYGQSAYAALWHGFTYSHTLPFSYTVNPTPVPSSELVFPPPLYPTGVQGAYKHNAPGLPADFIWGLASSAWQVEGGTQFAGRGPTVLDYIGSVGFPLVGGEQDSVIADMAYFYYQQDILRLAAIGVPYYSFSISWTRILPFGHVGSPVNMPGLQHYNDVVNYALAHGVTPIVTLCHFDYPLSIPFSSPDFADAFLYYSKIVMTHLGDRVSHWVTLNEPNAFISTIGMPLSSFTNVLMAHASVYRFYKSEYNGTGQVSLKIANNFAVPLNSSSPGDYAAAMRSQDVQIGILANPLFLGQNYPQSVTNTANIALKPLNSTQLAFINGTIDYFSLDTYMTQFATSPSPSLASCTSNSSNPAYPICVSYTNVQANGWLDGDQGNTNGNYITPQYFREQLRYIWETFKPKGIMITEFGLNPFLDANKTVVQQKYDLERTLFIQQYLNEAMKSRALDKVNIIGAIVWSIMDNNEFGNYGQQFGVQYVNRIPGFAFMQRSFRRSIFDLVDFFARD